MLPINQSLLLVGVENRPGIFMTPKYITVHNTGNTGVGANAQSHANYLKKPEAANAPVSWHYTVDDHSIFQHIPTNESAYHATDGAGQGNRASIGIEICVNSDGNYAQAEANAIELIRWLMDKYGIPITNVVPHQHWYEKYCPYKILPRWNAFINTIKSGAAYTPPTVDGFQKYTIKAGDNLWVIASKNGIEVAEILKVNPSITSPSLIQVGQVINIPVFNNPAPIWINAPAITYKTVYRNHTFISGDTLWGLSRKYNVTVEALKKANPTLNPYGIRVGTVVKVPYTITIYPQLKINMKGESVKVLQNALTKAGNYTGAIDGVFGGGTEGALRAFQKANGITADGICGSTSWNKLKAYI